MGLYVWMNQISKYGWKVSPLIHQDDHTAFQRVDALDIEGVIACSGHRLIAWAMAQIMLSGDHHRDLPQQPSCALAASRSCTP